MKRALIAPIALAVACSPDFGALDSDSSLIDQDGDGYSADIDCDDNNPNIVPEDDGTCALGTNCMDILSKDADAADGVYWIDPDGPMLGEPPFPTSCDMSGGGYTRVPMELTEDLEWMQFEVIAGLGDALTGWINLDAFLLDPRSVDGCNTVAVRATLTLPFQFTSWRGTWTGSAFNQESQHDDKHSDTDWGQTTDDCRGHLKFGTDLDTLKVGGEWGLHWNAPQYESHVFEWDSMPVQPSSVIRWELADQGFGENAVIRDIAIWVR